MQMLKSYMCSLCVLFVVQLLEAISVHEKYLHAKLALVLAMEHSSGFPVYFSFFDYLFFFKIVCCLFNFFTSTMMNTRIFPFFLSFKGEITP